jgi:hypothetical protein
MVLKKTFKYCLFILIAMLWLKCTTSTDLDRNIVAEVNDRKLFADDLADIIPTDIGQEDSTLIAREYIEKWVKQELIIQKANENLSDEQKDVRKELLEYRNSLIIYKYKNELMKQRMDTAVSDADIELYYNAHPESFKLNKNIVKAIFVKIPNEVSNPSLLKSMVVNTSEEGISDLRDYCLQYAKGFDIFIDNWVDFETVKNNIPQNIEDVEQFLGRNNQIELNDSNYYYLVRIQEYKLRNELAPLEYMSGNIKSLLLNQRKIEFLKEIEQSIYLEGIKKNKFRIHE